MSEIVRVERPEDLAALPAGGEIAPLEPALAARHRPDLHLALVDAERLAARASLFWHDVPAWPDARLGAIGHYAARTAVDGHALLEAACAALAEAGCGVAVGPMDGNTWRSYRLVTERGVEPPFLMEPTNPDDWPRHFAGAGFEVIATYHSSVAEPPQPADPRLAAARARLEAAGVRVREIDLTRFAAELDGIFALARAAFARNYLYTPITREEFVAQYLPYAERIEPRFVLVAERGGRAIGFLFAIPDWLEAARTGRATTVIAKTVAVDPARRHAGLGAVLVGLVHERAAALGYRRVIHALMHDANVSTSIGRRHTRVMRRYALYARRLAASGSTA
ncbi:MAG: GNAT family N-acetyltransferase [Burkholderiales bacterium]|nr:GNAT family N-acetyltransferase [Burkholderiales bacterium]